MPSVVQHNDNEANYGSSSPQTVALNGTTAGNLIVVIVANQGSPDPPGFQTPTDGVNTYHPCPNASGDDGVTNMEMYYAPNIAGGNVTISVSFTSSSAYIAIYAFELNGCDTYDNGAFGAAQSSTANATTPSFNLSYANEIIIAATINSNSATSQGPGYTLIEITSSFEDCLEYMIAGAGSETATAILSGSSQNWGIVAGAFYKATSTSVVLPTDAVFYGMT